MKNHQLHNLKGENKKQLLITTDRNGKQLGTATREECHKAEGKTHLAFMAFIINKGKIVLAKRNRRKSLWGGFWDASVVSHVLSDETVQQAAKRRGKEELGMEVDFKDLGAFYYFAKHGKAAENEYCHVLIGRTDEKIYHNPIEIEEIKLMGKDELKKEIKTNSHVYTPWLKLALEKFRV